MSEFEHIDKPKGLRPVLAKISTQTDLGYSEWYEVVYFDEEQTNQWKSYSGSNTFEDEEKVLSWKYADECFSPAIRADREERDVETELLQAVQRFVDAKGGKTLIVGGIEIQQEAGKFNYKLSVRFTGKPPEQALSTSETEAHAD